MKVVQRSMILAVLILALVVAPTFAVEALRLATTTSTENSGLLAELLPAFEKANNARVDVIAVGTGKAIKLGQNGDVDVILVHARSREDRFVADGHAIDRRDVMYNDFVVLGPVSDSARIMGTSDVAAAMSQIANSGATFVSRGDDSGTHTREKQLWKAGGVTPGGEWYLEAGRGMGDVIIMANERQGYTLADRGTYLAFMDKIDLKIALEGDSRMFNPYGVIIVNPAKHPHVKVDLAKKFLDFLTSDQAKDMITGFRRGGEQLFYVQ